MESFVNEVTVKVSFSVVIVAEMCSGGKKTENERKGTVQGTASD